MLGLYLGALAALIWWALSRVDGFEDKVDFSAEAQAAIILFLALLPLLNAVFDFFSIGLTRYLLRKGARKAGAQTIGFALLDLISGL